MNDLSKLPAKKSLGQHFLTSPVVPRLMCDAAALVPGDFVVEIGPGTGVLTREILSRGASVVALEADLRAITLLEQTFEAEITTKKLVVTHCDVRSLEVASLPIPAGHTYKVVANIPYYLSGLLFRTFLSAPRQPSTLVYLVQKEVAKRATANQKRGEKESLLSLSVQAYGEPKYIKTVSRGHFTPPPKVDSGIIAITNISRQHFATCDEAHFFKLLHLGFGQKRKQLLGNLTPTFDRAVLLDIFHTLNIPATIRAEDLSINDWFRLTRALQ